MNGPRLSVAAQDIVDAIAAREVKVHGRVVRAGTEVTVRVPPRERLQRVTVQSIDPNDDINCWLKGSYRTFSIDRIVRVHRTWGVACSVTWAAATSCSAWGVKSGVHGCRESPDHDGLHRCSCGRRKPEEDS